MEARSPMHRMVVPSEHCWSRTAPLSPSMRDMGVSRYVCTLHVLCTLHVQAGIEGGGGGCICFLLPFLLKSE